MIETPGMPIEVAIHERWKISECTARLRGLKIGLDSYRWREFPIEGAGKRAGQVEGSPLVQSCCWVPYVVTPRQEFTVSKARGSAPLFAALGDETRLQDVFKLCSDGPMSIKWLAVGAAITRQAITKHLRVMEKAGLVRHRRHGRESIWQLEERRLKETRFYLERISKQWEGALFRLGKFVEE